jgi:hypothetical protein
MNSRIRFALLAGMLLTVALTGTVQGSNRVIIIDFVKDCPVDTCDHTADSPVDVHTQVTSYWVSGPILHYTATETLTSDNGSVTIDLVGQLNYARTPNLTVLSGVVTAGSWGGVSLVRAEVHAWAERIEGTTFGGSVQIMPASND